MLGGGWWWPTLLLVLCVGCGAPGDPLPPLLNIPARTVDLEAVQRGQEVIVTWTVPAQTTEGMPLKDLGRVALLDGEEERESWEGLEPGQRVEKKLPVRVEAGKRMVLAVRNYSRRGRSEGQSNVVTLEVAAAPAAPGRVTAAARVEGVRLEWEGEAGASAYQVRRAAGDEKDFAVIGQVESSAYTDRDVKWKTRYRYFVRPVVRTSTGVAEGADSVVVEVTPEDTFPPSTPAGVQVAVTESAADLSWNLSPEPDTAGYYVYRDGRRLTKELLSAPAYTDRDVRQAGQYSYEISAVDREGNESPRSAPVRVTIP